MNAKRKTMLVTSDVLNRDLMTGVLDSAGFLTEAQREFDIIYAVPDCMAGDHYYDDYFKDHKLGAPSQRFFKYSELIAFSRDDGRLDFDFVVSFDSEVRSKVSRAVDLSTYVEKGYKAAFALPDVIGNWKRQAETMGKAAEEDIAASVPDFARHWNYARYSMPIAGPLAKLRPERELPAHDACLSRENFAGKLEQYFRAAIIRPAELDGRAEMLGDEVSLQPKPLPQSWLPKLLAAVEQAAQRVPRQD